MRGQKTEQYIHIADWFAIPFANVDPTDETAAKANLPPVDWTCDRLYQDRTQPRIDILISKRTLISGPYKILTGIVPQASWTGPQYPNTSHPVGIAAKQDCDTGCLYNVMDDPEERNDLAKTETQILKEKQQKLAKYQVRSL